MRGAIGVAAAAALLSVTAASAKELTRVVAVGANGSSIEVTGLDWDALRVTPGGQPTGGYVLVYPLMERGVPAQPGRFYPSTGAACFSWDRSVPGSCYQPDGGLASRLAQLAAIDGPPTILSRLTVAGRRARLNSNGAVAIELALQRAALSRPVPRRPLNCVAVRASWVGPASVRRPTRLWSCRTGLWAAGRSYPVGPLTGI
jgi:hypothetical protein